MILTTLLLLILISLIIYSIYNFIRIGKFFWVKKRFFNCFTSYIPNILWEPDEQYFLNKYIHKNDIVLQLGGNVGTSCIFVDKIVKQRHRQICVEPNLEIIKLLQENKYNNNSKFKIIDGVITDKTDMYLQNTGIDDIAFETTETKKNSDSLTLKTYRLDSLGNFNVIFADCEGCLVNFIKEYPNVLLHINKIIYEKDNSEKYSYDSIENLFKTNNFTQLEEGFVCVWMKKKSN